MKPQELYNTLFEMLTEKTKKIIMLHEDKYTDRNISTEDFLNFSKDLKKCKYEYRENAFILSDNNLDIYVEKDKELSFCMFTEKKEFIYASFIIQDYGLKFERFNKIDKKIEGVFIIFNNNHEKNDKDLRIIFNAIHSQNMSKKKSEIMDLLSLSYDLNINSELINVMIEQQLEYIKIIEINNKEKENKPKLPFI